MNIKPTNISDEEKTRIFEESLKNQTPYVEKEPVKIQPVKHGRWIDHEKFERNNCNVCIECSVCNTWFGHDCIPKTKFCPNCGADMRERRTENDA